MLQLELQVAGAAAEIPTRAHFQRWVDAAAGPLEGELVIRVVDIAESTQLNQTYRGKSGPTNVLSFPFQAPPGVAIACAGDLVICAEVVNREAREQKKSVLAHWAHMVVHGLLHLRGYDHVEETDAVTMEAEETKILEALGFSDPYRADAIEP